MSTDKTGSPRVDEAPHGGRSTGRRRKVRVGLISNPAPTMPSSDIQELLVHRVTEQSIERMKSTIRATVGIVVVIATAVGGESFLRISALTDRAEQASKMTDTLRAQIRVLNGEIESADHLGHEVQNLIILDKQAFTDAMASSQMTAQSATREAYHAADLASTASGTASAASQHAAERLAQLEQLSRQVDSTNRAVLSHGSQLDALRDEIHRQVFETWTVILDEHGEFVPVGTSDLEAAATRIHAGKIVDVALRDRHRGTPVCAMELRTSGAHEDCRYEHDTYRVTLVLPLKQGGLFGLFGLYRDRAEVQVVRMSTMPPDSSGL